RLRYILAISVENIFHSNYIKSPRTIPYQRNEPKRIQFNPFVFLFTHPQDGHHLLLFFTAHRDNQHPSYPKLFEHHIGYKWGAGSDSNLIVGRVLWYTF